MIFLLFTVYLSTYITLEEMFNIRLWIWASVGIKALKPQRLLFVVMIIITDNGIIAQKRTVTGTIVI